MTLKTSPMLIQWHLPAVSSDSWKDITEENVKAVDRTQGRQSFLWIKKAFGLIFYIAGYLAAVVCGISGSIPHKRTDRKSKVHCVNFFNKRQGMEGKILSLSEHSGPWLGERKSAYSPNRVASIRFAG